MDEGRVLRDDRVRRGHALVVVDERPGRRVRRSRYLRSVAPVPGDGLRRLHAVPRQQIVKQQLVVLAGLQPHLLEQARKELAGRVRRARGVDADVCGGGIVLVRRHVQIQVLERRPARLLVRDDVAVRGAPEHIHTFREPHVGLEEDEVVVVLLAARRAQVNKLLM